jgi:hypothetical protein
MFDAALIRGDASMSDQVMLTITEYDRLSGTIKEVDRFIEQAKLADFAAEHLLHFRQDIFDELSVVEKEILTSSPENEYEAAEQLKFASQIVRQKLLDRNFDQNTETGFSHSKSSELLEIAKVMASVAQQL